MILIQEEQPGLTSWVTTFIIFRLVVTIVGAIPPFLWQ